MTGLRAVVLAWPVLALTACSVPVSVPPPAIVPIAGTPLVQPDGTGGPACPVIRSRDWAAWVNAMPGPNPPHLIVIGKATVPSGGYTLRLSQGPVLRSDPPVQQIILNVIPPSGAGNGALVEHEVRGEYPALGSYGAVTIHCGGKILARLTDIQRPS